MRGSRKGAKVAKKDRPGKCRAARYRVALDSFALTIYDRDITDYRGKIMRYPIVFILLLVFVVSGCGSLPHSIGPKNVRVDKDPAGAPLARNKKIYVSMIGGVPEDMDGSPEALILQFSKFLAPVASGVSPAERLETREEAMRNAVAQSCDYVFLLTVEQWEKPLFPPSIRVAVNVEALEVGSGRFLSDSRLESTCHAMLYGLENSPRECVRPQVDIWLNTLFAPGSPATTAPYPNVMPPPPSMR